MDEIEKQIYKYSENDMDTLRAMLNGSHKANKFLQSLADKRLELLKRLEWTPLYFSTLKKIIYTCVVCSQSKEDGHTDDCELAEAIDGR